MALYECAEGFGLEDSEQDRLYCSDNQWVGDHPVCVSVEEETDEEGKTLYLQSLRLIIYSNFIWSVIFNMR